MEVCRGGDEVWEVGVRKEWKEREERLKLFPVPPGGGEGIDWAAFYLFFGSPRSLRLFEMGGGGGGSGGC